MVNYKKVYGNFKDVGKARTVYRYRSKYFLAGPKKTVDISRKKAEKLYGRKLATKRKTQKKSFLDRLWGI